MHYQNCVIQFFLIIMFFLQIDVHGRTQITYKGWPVYYFGQDAARGDNKGVSVGGPGKWPVINEATPLAPQ